MESSREALKLKALEAASPEEIAALVRDAGDEITAEEAEQLFEQAKKRREDMTFSRSEMEAVSGVARDWLTDGCAATVEAGSDCWTTDGGCSMTQNQYINFDASKKCPSFPGPHVYERDPKVPYRFACKYCGQRWQIQFSDACAALA